MVVLGSKPVVEGEAEEQPVLGAVADVVVVVEEETAHRQSSVSAVE
jgi:hypothetical protein